MELITKLPNGTAVYYDYDYEDYITTTPTNCSWIDEIHIETKDKQKAIDLAEVIDNEQEG